MHPVPAPGPHSAGRPGRLHLLLLGSSRSHGVHYYYIACTVHIHHEVCWTRSRPAAAIALTVHCHQSTMYTTLHCVIEAAKTVQMTPSRFVEAFSLPWSWHVGSVATRNEMTRVWANDADASGLSSSRPPRGDDTAKQRHFSQLPGR